ncbi:MAG TPA: hypothetical protein VF807_04130 [Ktedonobacterales bacterium]
MTAHLAGCAECRKRQADYRLAGEMIRDLPTIVPPASFRESVFAAIAAEMARTEAAAQSAPAVEPALAALAQADTDPSLPIVRLAIPQRALHAVPLRRPLRASRSRGFDLRMLIGAAAVLVLSLLTATLVPASPFYLGGARATVIAPDAQFSHVTSTAANARWLTYVGRNGAGASMLLAVPRSGGSPVALLSGASQDPLRLWGATTGWAIWQSGSGDHWALKATTLPGADGSVSTATLIAAQPGTDGPQILNDVNVSRSIALVAVSFGDGSSAIMRFDLTSSVPTVREIARSTTLGHTLTSPSHDGSAYFWAEVWMDGAQSLHSAIWHGNGDGQGSQLSDDTQAFSPRVADGTLVWVEAPDAQASSPDLATAVSAVRGTVEASPIVKARSAAIGQSAHAGTLAAAGHLALWAADSGYSVQDLASQSASSLSGTVRNAASVSLSDSAVVWQDAGASAMHVADA